jgi:hypothetical protein
LVEWKILWLRSRSIPGVKTNVGPRRSVEKKYEKIQKVKFFQGTDEKNIRIPRIH